MLAVPVVLCLLSGTPSALQGPASHWLRFEGGAARLGSHGLSGLDTPWGGVRVGGALDRGGVLALDLGLQGGTGPESFSSFTLGAEIRLAPRSRLSGFVRAEIGTLDRASDSDYGLVGAGGGLAVRLRRELAFRAGVTWNVHGALENGPVQAYGGLELGWWRGGPRPWARRPDLLQGVPRPSIGRLSTSPGSSPRGSRGRSKGGRPTVADVAGAHGCVPWALIMLDKHNVSSA